MSSTHASPPTPSPTLYTARRATTLFGIAARALAGLAIGFALLAIVSGVAGEQGASLGLLIALALATPVVARTVFTRSRSWPKAAGAAVAWFVVTGALGGTMLATWSKHAPLSRVPSPAQPEPVQHDTVGDIPVARGPAARGPATVGAPGNVPLHVPARVHGVKLVSRVYLPFATKSVYVPGLIAYAPPDSVLRRGVPEGIEFTFVAGLIAGTSAADRDALATAAPRGKVESTTVARSMRMELHSAPADAFRITALSGTSPRPVPRLDEVHDGGALLPRWAWAVTPLRTPRGGETFKLLLTTYPYTHDGPSAGEPGVAALDSVVVPVSVDWGYRTRSVGLSVAHFTDRHAAEVLGSSGLIAVLLGFVRDRRKQSAPDGRSSAPAPEPG